jgi:hypothetical protein
MLETPPTITSFVIRFVQEDPQTRALPYRGTIRHIPTNEEIHFTRWAEAEAFLRRFVSLDMDEARSTGGKGGL